MAQVSAALLLVARPAVLLSETGASAVHAPHTLGACRVTIPQQTPAPNLRRSLSFFSLGHTYPRGTRPFCTPSLSPQAAREGGHDRVAMYLRKYREGKALKGELPRIGVYNTALRALDQCSKWRL